MVNQDTREEEINEIARELQREISAHQASMGRVPQIGGEPGPYLVREQALERVCASMRVNPHLPIAWPDWPEGLWPKVVAAMQKAVRRLLRWYIDPIVEQQNAYNAEVAEMLSQLHSRGLAQEEAVADLRARWAETDSDDK
jgi:hypothetical protein